MWSMARAATRGRNHLSRGQSLDTNQVEPASNHRLPQQPPAAPIPAIISAIVTASPVAAAGALIRVARRSTRAASEDALPPGGGLPVVLASAAIFSIPVFIIVPATPAPVFLIAAAWRRLPPIADAVLAIDHPLTLVEGIRPWPTRYLAGGIGGVVFKVG